MPTSIFYVSRSRLAYPRDRDEFVDIQMTSLARNSTLDLTGVLIATPRHFAQFLEGEADAVAATLDVIRRDPRHHAIALAPRFAFATTLFPTWRMACFAPGTFVSRHVEPIIARNYPQPTAEATHRILTFMRETAPDYVDAPTF